MNCIINAVVSGILLSKVAMVKGMSLQDWNNMYCPEDTSKCLDGHCCKLGVMYCSNKSETCEPVFPSKLIGIEEKLIFCCKNMNISSISIGKHLSTACNYLFGKNNLPKECKGNKELIPVSTLLPEPEWSKSTIAAWSLFGVALFCILALCGIIFYLCRHMKKPKQVDHGIKASPKDTNLSQQRPLSQEQYSLLAQPGEAPTQVKELLLNKSNSTFDEAVAATDERVEDYTPQSVVATDERGVNYTPQSVVTTDERGVNYTLQSCIAGDERGVNYAPQCSEANQVHTPPLVAGLMNILFSPADNHGKTLVSPSGEPYRC